MRLRNAFVLAALAIILTACGSESITGSQLRGDDASPSAGIGWAGGQGYTAPTDGDT